MGSFGFEERGSKFSDSYRIFLTADGNYISPFHDIPLYAAGSSEDSVVLNMVVEVCRFTNAKMEISKELKLNPIKQDVKKGKMRFISNVFPNKGYPWNYGAFPQTWEDPNPNSPDQHTGFPGDNDPLDVCDISDIIPPAGSVIQVKVLGILAMIDEDETDWKVIAMNIADPQIGEFTDIQDVERVKPGLLRRTVEWFKYYKVPDGKPINKFAFNEEFKDKQFAAQVVKHTNESWKALMAKEISASIALVNTTVASSSDKVDSGEATAIVDANAPLTAESALPDTIDKFYYVPAGI